MKTRIIIFAIIVAIIFWIAALTIAGNRSSQWPKVRDTHLKQQPRCAVCDGVIKLEVHHIVPFSVKPELELDPNNLITLCEAKKYGVNCHLLIGHCGNYRWSNPDVISDANYWHRKLIEARNH